MADANNTSAKEPDNKSTIFGVAAVVFLVWAIAVTVMLQNQKGDSDGAESPSMAVNMKSMNDMLSAKTTLEGLNVCAGKKISLENIDCFEAALDDGADVTEAVVAAGPQAGANVTEGYNGLLEIDVEPITTPYYQAGLCPVNVHWHLGTEHYSAGEYDCQSHADDEHRNLMEDTEACGPTAIHERRKLAGKARQGFQCNLYDSHDEKFTKPYEWKYCDKSMEIGQTYEVHWPHSAAGSCGTPNQYQTPFYDGVFCNLDMETLVTLQPQDIASNVGVQAQVFVIVNDESYYYPDLIKGMIVEPGLGFGSDMAIYTGSTTGTSRDNTICSAYAPITWQVDRKCHMISASSFDKMCADMMEQRDDMTDDLYAHGSRTLVAYELAANNFNRNLRA